MLFSNIVKRLEIVQVLIQHDKDVMLENVIVSQRYLTLFQRTNAQQVRCDDDLCPVSYF